MVQVNGYRRSPIHTLGKGERTLNRAASRWLVVLLLSSAMGGVMGGAAAHPPHGPASLQKLASQRGLTWGTAMASEALDQQELQNLIVAEVGAITPENSLKWDATEPTPGRFNLAESERQLAWARSHGLTVRGHTLVWHQQLPTWVQALNGPQLRSALERHVRTLSRHGRGRIRSWDVVNEPLDEQGFGLRQNLWLNKLGPGYIAAALRWARQEDPSARLMLNDYGLEGDDPQTARKRRSLLTLIDALQRDRVPLDGIGLQAHLLAPRSGKPQFSTLPLFLRQLRERGLVIEITELDVSDRELPADIDRRDEQVAATYDAFLAAVLSEPALRQITTWGISDRSSWLQNAFPRSDGLPQRPLPYDNALHPKRALSSIRARLLQRQ